MIATIKINNQNATTVISVTPTNGYRGYTVEKIFSAFKIFVASENATIQNEQFIKDQINTVI